MNTRLVNCYLFDRPVPIAAALLAVASQLVFGNNTVYISEEK